MKLLKLRPGLKVVRGAQRGALYDLVNRRVYWLNGAATRIASLLYDGAEERAIARTLRDFLRVNLREAQSEVNQFLETIQTAGLLEVVENTRPAAKPTQLDRRLRQVWCEITYACNLRCLHCYANASFNSRVTCKALGLIKFLEFLAHMGDIGCRGIQFTGGEPLLRRADLWQMVQAARKAGIPAIEIFSNLTLVTPHDVAQMRQHGVTIATTILGHTAEVHDSVTQVKGSFEKTVRSLKVILAEGIPVRVGVVVVSENEGFENEIRRFLANEGVREVRFDFVRPVGRGQSYRSKLRYTGVSSDVFQPPSAEGFYYVRHYNPCWGHHLALTPEGNVTICVFSRTVNIGNIHTEQLEKLVEKAESYWRLTKDKLNVCKDCEFRYACHDCRPLAMALGSGNLYAKTAGCTYDPYERGAHI